MAVHTSIKRLQIDKANTTIVVAVAIAAFSLTFSLIAARSLMAKRSYQGRVEQARETARDQLKENIDAVDQLKNTYREFATRQENLIGGSSTGDGPQDGDNARIVLDALPSKYDFPALVSSLEKILVDRSYSINSISGTDEEATRNGDGTAAVQPSTVPAGTDPATLGTGQQQNAGQTQTTAVEMPFELSATAGDYKAAVSLLRTFNQSIRPMKLRTLIIAAQEGSKLEVRVTAHSYYQPERTLNIIEEVIP